MNPVLSLLINLVPPALLLLLIDTALKTLWWKPAFQAGIPLPTFTIRSLPGKEPTVDDLTVLYNQMDRSSTMKFRKSGKVFLFRSIFFSQGNSDTGFTFQSMALFDGILEPRTGHWVLKPILHTGRLICLLLITLFFIWLMLDLSGPTGRGDALIAVSLFAVIVLGYVAYASVTEWARLKDGSARLQAFLLGEKQIPRPRAEDYG